MNLPETQGELARLKAEWQAEALEAVFLELEPISYRSASIMASKAAELRRRAQDPHQWPPLTATPHGSRHEQL